MRTSLRKNKERDSLLVMHSGRKKINLLLLLLPFFLWYAPPSPPPPQKKEDSQGFHSQAHPSLSEVLLPLPSLLKKKVRRCGKIRCVCVCVCVQTRKEGARCSFFNFLNRGRRYKGLLILFFSFFFGWVGGGRHDGVGIRKRRTRIVKYSQEEFRLIRKTNFSFAI